MPLRRVCCFLFGSLAVASAPGCLSFHSSRPVPVLVRDAETKKPIPGAEVRISYPVGSGSTPEDSSGVSDGAGIAHVRAAPCGDAGILVTTRSGGYLVEERNVSTETIAAIEPEHWFKKTGPRPVGVIVEMYAEPRPAIELVVPNGYHGMVRAKLHLRDDAAWAQGQRVFACAVDSTGKAVAQLPSLLRRFYPLEFRARSADGTLLSREPGPQEIGLRRLRSADGEEIFVVGTQSELDYFRGLTRSEPAERPSGNGGGRGQGGGKRHRRGSQTQAASD